MNNDIKIYADQVSALYRTGVTTEHSFRGSLQTLLESLLPKYRAVNEPQRTACGAPDYALVGKNDNLPYAYIEAKDLFDNDLRGINAKGHKEQFDRYKQALSRVAFTDYLSFYFYVDGELKDSVTLLEQNVKGGFSITNEDKFVNLLNEWADCSLQPVNSATRLAQIMAHKAKLLADVICKSLKDDESTEIQGQYDTFRHVLIHDLTEESFADLYAQTIAYGMFAARLYDKTPEDFSRQEAASLIPSSNPFLRKIFQSIAGYDLDSRIAWIVDDLAKAFAVTDMDKIMGRYQQNSLHQDPLIHFYEDFLAAYNPALRKSCGVYYTPNSVVSFIVHAIDDILVRDFGLADGLADDGKMTKKVREPQGSKMIDKTFHRVQILDPATGTGTFLAETVRQIYKKFEGNEGMWPGYVEQSLRPRLHGFELLMAPYTITHLKLDMMLHGDQNSRHRLGVYLTNSLEECHPDTGTLWAQWLSEESTAANAIKRDTPVMVMMGNPPYSVSSSNKGEWISHLVDDYKKDLNERNIQPLSDDYIKFIRLGQYYIERNGSGILGYISNNSYLDGLIHRQMRKTLLEVFDDIYIVNLHGNSKRKETAPDGGKDESVFDIMVGTNIALFVKHNDKKKKGKLATVHYLDLYGLRKNKYEALDALTIENANWQMLECKAPNYFFVPKDFGLQDEYEKGVKIDELFSVFNSGIKTQRDDASVFFDRQTRDLMIEDFNNLSEIDLKIKYQFKDVRDWQVNTAKNDVIHNARLCEYVSYRPFDNRYCIYTGKTKGVMGYPRYETMRHMLKENCGIVIMRKQQNTENFKALFISNEIIDLNYYGFQTYLFPLYLYDADGTRRYNMKTELLGGRNPEEFFAYAYAVLHSPAYREKYREFLKIDFPRIPSPEDETEYQRLVVLGQQLIDLHLMRVQQPMAALPKFPIAGSNVVEAVKYENGKVFINTAQYFDGVSQTAWEFFIGGYQPAQKWLKDRKGRTLNLDDIRHYQQVVAILDKTDALMKEIG
ncbi:MAG: N-6 DNA methylase [Bacteroidales bacterium]|nr:N-6 DNA methylase [Bacteroidales bacterium]